MSDDLIELRKARGDKALAQVEVDVVSIKEDGKDSYKLIFEIPESSYQDELSCFMDLSRFDDLECALPKREGVYFPIGSGIGIPPFSGQKSRVAHEIIPFLKQVDNKELNDIHWLTPYRGYPGVDLATPSVSFLERLLNKAGSQHVYYKRLKEILSNHEDLEYLQSSYDMYDVLALFKGVLTAKDIWDTQEKGPMNRTYSIIPEPITSKERGAICFSVSVKKQISEVVHNLFGENSKSKHYGINSSQLTSLEIGDSVVINKKVKPSKAFTPKTQHQKDIHKPIVFISQGNALERCVTLLYERDKNVSQTPFILFAGFKTEKHITGKLFLSECLDSNLITEAHFALSREANVEKAFNSKAHFYGQKRIDVLLADFDFSKIGNETLFYITGSESFCEHMKDILLGNKSFHASETSIKLATSPNRLRAPAVAI